MVDRLWEPIQGDELPKSLYQYRTVAIEHLSELQNDFESLDSAGKISHNEVFRKYLEGKTHEQLTTFSQAKSVIVIAVYTPLLTTNFHYNGKPHEVLVPHYYEDGITEEHLKNTIQNQIIGNADYRIENANQNVLFKRLAVRSGLGKYGRNNLCYVDGFGSFVRLHAFFTDYEFKEDNWTDARMMDSCEKCKICQNNCPTGSINDENFVIDIEKCIPLYNEIKGEFPEWMDPSWHNALMGCIRCQIICPANNKVVTQAQRFDDVSEEETKALLEGDTENDLIEFLWTKLRMFRPEDAWYFVPVFSRNLQVLLHEI